jgi:hypothetical protein
VTAAESYARTVGLLRSKLTRDEVAILKLFNSPAAPIRDQAIALEIYAWQATTLKPSESPAR